MTESNKNKKHLDFVYSHIEEGSALSALETMYPSQLFVHKGAETILSSSTSTYYGVVVSGAVQIKISNRVHPLDPGMYFSIAGPGQITGKGSVAVFERLGYVGLNQIGGPVESTGRLCYIDYCSSTVLVSPARKGDPVLNLLYFPPHTKQSMHIHPSVRLGVVLSGSGKCESVDKPSISLAAGNTFLIPASYPHRFHSDGDGLVVIAYHPDSDVGPTDDIHPMISRTYLSK